jgi:hypothetical protein
VIVESPASNATPLISLRFGPADLYTSFRVYGTYVRTRKADGVEIERIENQSRSAAPVSGVSVSVEGI